MALTLVMRNPEEKPPFKNQYDHPLADHDLKSMPSKSLTRFLAGDARKKGRLAADHCRKDGEVCSVNGEYGVHRNSTNCCNKKCRHVETDKHNCGGCGKQCQYTYSCCRGECVDLAFDKRHCGKCDNRCMPGGYCIYRMCDYA
ncbi:stigma-specific STIG1-like protein 3 [Malania oleifera]|uniref:stigma-specific STIG1-like protein 3 n=1 Tax=Malania oleifera TaxID=397392 RepID=UPI0025AEA0F0|nr:stigma-specific STIG1-like protein 3 [Malania oleifera]